MAKNPIYGHASFDRTRSKQLRGRVELGSLDVMAELNTYKNFGIFHTWNDVYSQKWDPDAEGCPDVKGDPSKGQVPGTPGVRSLFNKYSSVLTGTDKSSANALNGSMDTAIQKLVEEASGWRISNNVPLLDTPDNRKAIELHSGCTVRELVQASQQGHFGTATYSYADFMYCKYLNKVPNNYLITLRRFPVPVLDSIMPTGTGTNRRKEGKNDQCPPMGTMVTWLGVSGNDMKGILKYSYKMDWEEKTADWQEVQKDGQSPNAPLSGLEAALNPAARKKYGQGGSVPALDNFMKTFFGAGDSPYSENMGDQEDKNKLYGPIDRVKSSYMRGQKGLSFDQNITLVFEYELRAYNGINPRQAMLDLIASILSTTYTTGGFWKGGYRGGGVRQSNLFRNLEIFKNPSGIGGIMDAVYKDSSTLLGAVQNFINDAGGIKEAATKVLNSAASTIFAGLVNRAGRPTRYVQQSLVSPEPTGLWHVTIGNPHHPIMVMGNMVLLNTEIEHSGPLGLDDFPTNLKVTCTLTRGKPRDQYGIENMYMQGNDRIFHTMEGKLGDMYNAAQDYQKNSKAIPATNSLTTMSPNQDATTRATTQGGNQVSDGTKTPEGTAYSKTVMSQLTNLKQLNDMWLKYFGIKDCTSVITSSEELNHGGFKPEKEEKDDKSGPQENGN